MTEPQITITQEVISPIDSTRAADDHPHMKVTAKCSACAATGVVFFQRAELSELRPMRAALIVGPYVVAAERAAVAQLAQGCPHVGELQYFRARTQSVLTSRGLPPDAPHWIDPPETTDETIAITRTGRGADQWMPGCEFKVGDVVTVNGVTYDGTQGEHGVTFIPRKP